MSALSLALCGVSFRHAGEGTGLKEISFDLRPGECAAVIGPNGAGKTTLLHLIAGALTPSQGEIFLDGERADEKARRGKTGLVFQNPDDQLFMPSVIEDVAFGPRNFGAEADEAKRRAAEALAKTDSAHLADRHPARLSGGEKRAAALAAILVMNPGILLLDEPSSDLDHRHRRGLMNLLAGRKETRLIATHDLPMARDLCGRIILLDEGRLVADGAAGEILEDEILLSKHGLEAV